MSRNEDFDRGHVYAAEATLPPFERLRAVSDSEVKRFAAQHLDGVEPDILDTDKYGSQLTGQWLNSKSFGRVPVITRPRGYPIGIVEAAHETAHLAVTQHDPEARGHHAAFRDAYLRIAPARISQHLGRQFTERFAL